MIILFSPWHSKRRNVKSNSSAKLPQLGSKSSKKLEPHRSEKQTRRKQKRLRQLHQPQDILNDNDDNNSYIQDSKTITVYI